MLKNVSDVTFGVLQVFTSARLAHPSRGVSAIPAERDLHEGPPNLWPGRLGRLGNTEVCIIRPPSRGGWNGRANQIKRESGLVLAQTNSRNGYMSMSNVRSPVFADCRLSIFRRGERGV